MSFFVTFILVNSVVVFANGPSHGMQVVCYMHSWSHYRKDLGHFRIEDIDPSLCTNVIYAFASLDETTNSIKSADVWQDLETNYGLAAYRRVTSLKDNYPHLKVSISIGGWADGSAKYSKMAASSDLRRTFIQSVLEFLKLHNFDGLDMHWKFPTLRDGKPYDKANYVLLLKELKAAFKPHNYLLTAAFSAVKSTMEVAYDLAKLNQHLDYMHLLAFDYHGTWDGIVGANAPLIGREQGDLYSLDFTVNYMINNGVSPDKIVLGMASFGHTFELVDPRVKTVEFGRTSVKPVGFQGPYTAEPGIMGFNEICMETSNRSAHWVYHWDKPSSTAYIRNGGRVVSYDNGRAVANKVKMAVDRGLGGLMLLTLDTDDFRGQCDNEVDSYLDFQMRFTDITKNPALPRVIRSLNLPTSSSTDYYVTSNGQLSLRLPHFPPHSNYSLLRTMNAAAALAVQEKRILDALPKGDNDGVGGFRSDYLYLPRVGYWLKEHKSPADWHTARLQCHYEGAVLASPLNKQLATVLQTIVNSKRNQLFFTGVHQTFGHGIYTSVEGIPLDRLHITKWKDHQPATRPGKCLALGADGVLQYGCEARLPYICYRKLCDDDRLAHCGTIDKAYKLNHDTGHCYKLHTSGTSWTRALQTCGAEGGRLAVANSMAEANTLAELAGHRTSHVTLMGFRQGEDGNWWTVQGKSLASSGYQEWGPGWAAQSGQECGALLAGKLASVSCDARQPYICEKETDILTNATGVDCPSARGLSFLTC